ncbi:unnamed protein product, partial [Rhizoctonia solani]
MTEPSDVDSSTSTGSRCNPQQTIGAEIAAGSGSRTRTGSANSPYYSRNSCVSSQPAAPTLDHPGSFSSIAFHATPPFDYPIAYKPDRPRARPGIDRKAGSDESGSRPAWNPMGPGRSTRLVGWQISRDLPIRHLVPSQPPGFALVQALNASNRLTGGLSLPRHPCIRPPHRTQTLRAEIAAGLDDLGDTYDRQPETVDWQISRDLPTQGLLPHNCPQLF